MLVNSEGIADADAACGATARLACAQSVSKIIRNVTVYNYTLQQINVRQQRQAAKKP
jgi:hypothetical protein